MMGLSVCKMERFLVLVIMKRYIHKTYIFEDYAKILREIQMKSNSILFVEQCLFDCLCEKFANCRFCQTSVTLTVENLAEPDLVSSSQGDAWESCCNPGGYSVSAGC